MSYINHFWNELDNNPELYEDLDKLIQFFKDTYINEFIDDKNKWQFNLDNMNDMMLNTLNTETYYDTTKWKPVSFDQFCKGLINLGEQYILEHGYISTEIIEQICEDILRTHVESLNMPVKTTKNASIAQLLNSIKYPRVHI